MSDGNPLKQCGLSVGDRVRLLKLDAWFFNGIPEDETLFLKSCIGMNSTIQGFDTDGCAEIEFCVPDSETSCCGHTLWIDPSWLEKV